MKSKKKIPGLLVLIILILKFTGCTEPAETPTRGTLNLYTDGSVMPLITDEAYAFMDSYQDAKIHPVAVDASEGIKKIIEGSIKIFISSRTLNDSERKIIAAQKLYVEEYKFCYSGAAVIASKSNPVTQITYNDILGVLSGKDKRFEIFVPSKKSAIYEYLESEYLDNKAVINAKLLGSEKEVIEKIKNDNSDIGIVGFNTLSNIPDVKVLPVGLMDPDNHKVTFYIPHPAYFVRMLYPMTREIYILISERKMGLASGFASFLTSTDGQKIVLKNNLAPASVPVKLVKK